jgi:hypothetical protein
LELTFRQPMKPKQSGKLDILMSVTATSQTLN